MTVTYLFIWTLCLFFLLLLLFFFFFLKISTVSLDCATGLVTQEALNKYLLTDLIRVSPQH